MRNVRKLLKLNPFLHSLIKMGLFHLYCALPFCIKGKKAEWGVNVVLPLRWQWR